MKDKKSKSFFRLLIKNSFLIFAYLCLILVFLGLLSQFVSPETLWIPAFAGLIFPYLFIIFLIFFALILFRGYKKHILIFLPFLIFGFYVSNRFYHPGFFNEAAPEKGTIKVLSYNVRLFDLYNWKNKHVNKKPIFKFLEEEKADILCLQEYYYQNFPGFSTTDTFKNILPSKNVHQEFSVVNKNKYFFGIATFCKYPIVNKGKLTFEGTTNMCIFTDVLISGDTVRIYNNHLESIRFGQEDYKFIDKIDLDVDKEEVKDTKNILRRLKRAYVKRAEQVDMVTEHISKCPYPVIVCGDFNDTPVSYAYYNLSKGLKDAYCEAGRGFAKTYNGKLPVLRIDYIFHSPYFKAYEYNSPEVDFSDHFPVVCLLTKAD